MPSPWWPVGCQGGTPNGCNGTPRPFFFVRASIQQWSVNNDGRCCKYAKWAVFHLRRAAEVVAIVRNRGGNVGEGLVARLMGPLL